MNRDISIATQHGPLPGLLSLPQAARGLILRALLYGQPHEAASAADLASPNHAVLTISLLTELEMQFPDTAHNVPLLTERLLNAMDILGKDGDTELLPLAIYAAGPVSPAAIRAAARRDAQVRALACHGGLIDQAGLQNLKLLAAPLLLLADADDTASEAAFRRAAPYLSVPQEMMRLKPGERPDNHVARWFGEHLQGI